MRAFLFVFGFFLLAWSCVVIGALDETTEDKISLKGTGSDAQVRLSYEPVGTLRSREMDHSIDVQQTPSESPTRRPKKTFSPSFIKPKPKTFSPSFIKPKPRSKSPTTSPSTQSPSAISPSTEAPSTAAPS